MSNSARKLGPADRAVYDLVTRGAVNTQQAALYRHQVANLVRAKMIAKGDDGVYRTAAPSEPPPASTARAVMSTLVARVPQDVLDTLDSLGLPNRSEAARTVLLKALRPEVLDLLDLELVDR